MHMVDFVITGHATFAPGMTGALEMIAGPQEHFASVPFLEDEAATYPDAIADAIATASENPEGAVVFCDLMGGTPFNLAMFVAATYDDVDVVAGCNLPMLLESCSERMFGSTRLEVVEAALSAGTMGVAHKVFESEPETLDSADEGDGI